VARDELVAGVDDGPEVPPSPLTPVRALSNLFTTCIWRTPMSNTSCSRSSISAAVHCGWSSTARQSNSSEISMPRTTASRPALMVSRACTGLVTMRNQPSPGPPAWAST
jgi:hypothetical protein